MRIVLPTILALISTIHHAHASDLRPGNPSPELSIVHRISAKMALSAAAVDPVACKKVIEVVWHVMVRGTSTARADGYIPVSEINTEMTKLNAVYNKYAFEFVPSATLKSLNYWPQPPTEWDTIVYSPPENSSLLGYNEDALKRPRRLGGVQTLNIYTVRNAIKPDILGYSTFPWYLAEPAPAGAYNALRDGIVLTQSILNGGVNSTYGYSTLVHEVGHWLGLFHTHEGGCTDPFDDQVADTPRTDASEPGNCHVPPYNSCPGQTIRDLTFNLMGYSIDPMCRINITDGQVTRIHRASTLYRGFSACPL